MLRIRPQMGAVISTTPLQKQAGILYTIIIKHKKSFIIIINHKTLFNFIPAKSAGVSLRYHELYLDLLFMFLVTLKSITYHPTSPGV